MHSDEQVESAEKDLKDAELDLAEAKNQLESCEAAWEPFRAAAEKRRALRIIRAVSGKRSMADFDSDVPPEEKQARDAFFAAEDLVKELEEKKVAAREMVRARYRHFDLDPHRKDLTKFVQNAVRSMAGLSLALVTAVVAVAGVGTLPTNATDDFRQAFLSGIAGLALAFAYYGPLMLAHASDMRFMLARDRYEGRLLGRASNTWAMVLGLVVAIAQLAAWSIGVVYLIQVVGGLEFGPSTPGMP